MSNVCYILHWFDFAKAHIGTHQYKSYVESIFNYYLENEVKSECMKQYYFVNKEMLINLFCKREEI